MKIIRDEPKQKKEKKPRLELNLEGSLFGSVC